MWVGGKRSMANHFPQDNFCWVGNVGGTLDSLPGGERGGFRIQVSFLYNAYGFARLGEIAYNK